MVEQNAIKPARATYTPEQLEQYFDVVHLPARYRGSSIIQSANAATSDPSEALSLLAALIRFQITGIPWENLELHYSSHHTISIDPLHVFHKIVERCSGRGGYCMENTLLMATVLRSLGYEVMTTGARVNTAIQPISQSAGYRGHSFDGWNHMVCIVTIGRTKYLVDVGLGSHGPTFPVPFPENEAERFEGMNVKPSHEILLRKEYIQDNTHRANPEQLLWVYSLRFSKEMPWTPGYCFSEIEFLPQDFETMNFFVSKSPKSWFTYYVVCLRFLMQEDTEEIIGDITLFGKELDERRNGESKHIASLKSEEERVVALEKHIGVKLSGPERSGIEGMTSMIV